MEISRQKARQMSRRLEKARTALSQDGEALRQAVLEKRREIAGDTFARRLRRRKKHGQFFN